MDSLSGSSMEKFQGDWWNSKIKLEKAHKRKGLMKTVKAFIARKS